MVVGTILLLDTASKDTPDSDRWDTGYFLLIEYEKLAGLNLYVSTFSGEDSIVFDLSLHNCFKRMGK